MVGLARISVQVAYPLIDLGYRVWRNGIREHILRVTVSNTRDLLFNGTSRYEFYPLYDVRSRLIDEHFRR